MIKKDKDKNKDKTNKKNKEIEISKIVVDRNLCIGCGTCVALAPEVFELDNENKSVVKNPKGADGETILFAAQSCPVNAIILYDKNNKKIWPK